LYTYLQASNCINLSNTVWTGLFFYLGRSIVGSVFNPTFK